MITPRPLRAERVLIDYLRTKATPVALTDGQLRILMNVYSTKQNIHNLKHTGYIVHETKFDAQGENRQDFYQWTGKQYTLDEEHAAKVKAEREQRKHNRKQHRDIVMADKRAKRELSRKQKIEASAKRKQAWLLQQAERERLNAERAKIKQIRADELRASLAHVVKPSPILEQQPKASNYIVPQTRATLPALGSTTALPPTKHPLLPNGKRFKIPPHIPATPPGEPLYTQATQAPAIQGKPLLPPLEPGCEPIKPPTREQLMGGKQRVKRMPLREWKP